LQHTAYLRLERDLEDEKSKRPQTPTVASDTLQLQLTTMERQLTEARAATAELEHKYAASNTELEQQRQKIATYEQTIARLNEQVREPREARPQPRPKAKRASDYEFNIKDLREYGKEIVPYIPR
jgi:chromosome segregation ATPase